jgi:hypothetical protein
MTGVVRVVDDINATAAPLQIGPITKCLSGNLVSHLNHLLMAHNGLPIEIA